MMRFSAGKVDAMIERAATIPATTTATPGARRPQRLVELGAQEQIRGEESRPDRYRGADQQRHRALDGDDTAQHGQRRTGEAEQAERALAIVEAGDHGDREGAAGDRQAGQDDEIGQPLVPGVASRAVELGVVLGDRRRVISNVPTPSATAAAMMTSRTPASRPPRSVSRNP